MGAVRPTLHPDRKSAPVNPWLRFARQRLTRLAISAAAIVVLSFALIRLVPGDPIRAALGPQASAELVETLRRSNHLDGSLSDQFSAFLAGLVRGQLGTSFTTQLPVADVIAARLPVTLTLAFGGIALAVVIALIVGFPVAICTRGARRRGVSGVFLGVTGVISAIPEFVLAIIVIAVFAVALRLLPSGGVSGPESFILPILCVALGPAAALSRTLRAETSRVLDEEFMLIVRSKRLSRARTYLRHVLPNAIVSTIALGSILLASAIGGTVLVEKVFAMPGLGTTAVTAVVNRDYPLVQAIVILLGLAVVLIMTLLDVLLAVIDPRRLAEEGHA